MQKYHEAIDEIVDYIKNQLEENIDFPIKVHPVSHFAGEQPTHIVIKAVGIGHATIELFSLTRANLDIRIKLIQDHLSKVTRTERVYDTVERFCL